MGLYSAELAVVVVCELWFVSVAPFYLLLSLLSQ